MCASFMSPCFLGAMDKRFMSPCFLGAMDKRHHQGRDL